MPSIIDYPTVLTTLESAGLRCVYPNSGAFAPRAGDANHIVGWIAAEDSTIRPEMRAAARIVPPPASSSLSRLLTRAQHALPGPAWLMPASHWAYELQFGGSAWLAALLQSHAIDSESLRSRTDGSAIKFLQSENESLQAIVEALFAKMTASDFTLAFPGRAVVATLHHHQQLWWQTSDLAIWKSLDALT